MQNVAPTKAGLLLRILFVRVGAVPVHPGREVLLVMKSAGAPALSSLWGAVMVGTLLPDSVWAQMMGGSMMGGMMWFMAIFWLLIAAVLVLAIAALVKYLFKK